MIIIPKFEYDISNGWKVITFRIFKILESICYLFWLWLQLNHFTLKITRLPFFYTKPNPNPITNLYPRLTGSVSLVLYSYIFDFYDSVKYYYFDNSIRVTILSRYSAFLSRVFSWGNLIRILLFNLLRSENSV